MKFISLLFIFVCSSALSQTTPLQLKGKIGKYAIEMTVTDRDYITGELVGKYNYKGKKNALNLKGITYQSTFVLDEFYEGNNTGTFYLEVNEDKVEGKWIKDTKSYDVELEHVSGDWDMLFRKSLDAFNMETSNDVSGVYGNEIYFLNDMWFSEEKPQMEIGYNGGYVILEQTHLDSLQFEAELICGPTYHFASARGVALRTDSCFLYQNEDGCSIEIHPDTKNKNLFIVANNSFDCGFGARAHMDHSLVKISDEIPKEEWPNINKILGREIQKK